MRLLAGLRLFVGKSGIVSRRESFHRGVFAGRVVKLLLLHGSFLGGLRGIRFAVGGRYRRGRRILKDTPVQVRVRVIRRSVRRDGVVGRRVRAECRNVRTAVGVQNGLVVAGQFAKGFHAGGSSVGGGIVAAVGLELRRVSGEGERERGGQKYAKQLLHELPPQCRYGPRSRIYTRPRGPSSGFSYSRLCSVTVTRYALRYGSPDYDAEIVWVSVTVTPMVLGTPFQSLKPTTSTSVFA